MELNRRFENADGENVSFVVNNTQSIFGKGFEGSRNIPKRARTLRKVKFK